MPKDGSIEEPMGAVVFRCPWGWCGGATEVSLETQECRCVECKGDIVETTWGAVETTANVIQEPTVSVKCLALAPKPEKGEVNGNLGAVRYNVVECLQAQKEEQMMVNYMCDNLVGRHDNLEEQAGFTR